MALSKNLLEILVCPRCKGNLVYTNSDTPSLDCEACDLSYPVIEDIPVMLIDEALKLNK